jgi:hypothetical protein
MQNMMTRKSSETVIPFKESNIFVLNAWIRYFKLNIGFGYWLRWSFILVTNVFNFVHSSIFEILYVWNKFLVLFPKIHRFKFNQENSAATHVHNFENWKYISIQPSVS